MPKNPQAKATSKETWNRPALKKMDIEKTAQGTEGPTDTRDPGS